MGTQHPPVRYGLIGAGTIAFSAHLPSLQALLRQGEVELVSVADVRVNNAERAANEYGAETHYADYREMLAREQLDAVAICTPEFLHAEQVEAAAGAGLHIICEKPMAPSLADADRMINAADAANVVLMIGHSRRFSPRYEVMKAVVDRGEIGEVRYFRENERRPRAMYDGLKLGTGYWVPEGGQPWLTMAEYSFGAAMTNAVHETDLARWFVGTQPTSVYAEASILTDDGQVPDFITYTVTFENGAIGASEIVNQLPPGYPFYHLTEVIGTEGRAHALDTNCAPLLVADANGMSQPVNFATLLHIDSAYTKEHRAFIDTIRTGAPLPVTPQEARGAVELSVAAVLSSRRGQPVALPLTSEDV